MRQTCTKQNKKKELGLQLVDWLVAPVLVHACTLKFLTSLICSQLCHKLIGEKERKVVVPFRFIAPARPYRYIGSLCLLSISSSYAIFSSLYIHQFFYFYFYFYFYFVFIYHPSPVCPFRPRSKVIQTTAST